MNVLFVTNMWPDERRPWYGTFIKTQAESLQRLGISVDVLPIRGYESRWAYLRAARELRRRVRDSGYDVVHAHYGHAGVVARLQGAAPLIISYCGDDLLGTPSRNGGLTFRSRLEAFAFRQLTRVAAASITKSAEMEEALPGSRRRANRVIPNGVDMERFAPLPRQEARLRLGWSPEEAVVLFAGDPEIPRKNYVLAKAACEVASRDLAHLRLRVASGFRYEEMPILMSAADALLLTSLWEGSPNVVKEAMAAELPVVAVPAGDVAERLRGVPGCYIRPYDADALAEGLQIALQHGRTRSARDAVSELSLESVAAQVLAVYERVTGPASGPGSLSSRVKTSIG